MYSPVSTSVSTDGNTITSVFSRTEGDSIYTKTMVLNTATTSVSWTSNVSNSLSVLDSISELSTTATESDLVAGNHLVVDTIEGIKKLPADAVAKSSDAEKNVSKTNELVGHIFVNSSFSTSSATGTQYAIFNLDGKILEGQKAKLVIAPTTSAIKIYTRNSTSGSTNIQLIADLPAITEPSVIVFTASADIEKLALQVYVGTSTKDVFVGVKLEIESRIAADEVVIGNNADDCKYLKLAVGNVDTSTEDKYTTSFVIGKTTTTTTPDSSPNWFSSGKIIGVKKGDKIKWDGSKYRIQICVSTSETTVSNLSWKTGNEFALTDNYDFVIVTGYINYGSVGRNVTEEDLEDLAKTCYGSHEKEFAPLNDRTAEYPKNKVTCVNYYKAIAEGNQHNVKADTLNDKRFPNTIIWGWEFLEHWYEKIYNGDENVCVALSGDSITQGDDALYSGYDDYHYGMRNWAVKKIMKAGGFDLSKLRVVNCGVGGRSTNEWVGNNSAESQPDWSWIAKYNKGFLDEDMKLNPDLYVLMWGMNDANRGYPSALTLEQRINLFSANMTEGMERLRGNVAVNGRPAYNKQTKDLSIVIGTPTSGGGDASRGNDNWVQYAREVIRELCVKYECAFVDFNIRTYGYDSMTSRIWAQKLQSGSLSPIHPNKWQHAQFNSALSDLIYPVCFHQVGNIPMDYSAGSDDVVRYSKN